MFIGSSRKSRLRSTLEKDYTVVVVPIEFVVSVSSVIAINSVISVVPAFSIKVPAITVPTAASASLARSLAASWVFVRSFYGILRWTGRRLTSGIPSADRFGRGVGHIGFLGSVCLFFSWLRLRLLPTNQWWWNRRCWGGLVLWFVLTHQEKYLNEYYS